MTDNIFIPGTLILHDGFMSPDRARAMYADTPAHAPSIIPNGVQAHIGDGKWITRCRHEGCDVTAVHWGSLPRYASVGTHEVEVHGMQVAGINVGILA